MLSEQIEEFSCIFPSSGIRMRQGSASAAQWTCAAFTCLLSSSHDRAPLNPSSLVMTASCRVLVAELYASNYDNVSRPCSTAAAGLQPETGYQPAGQCCQLSISRGGTTGM